MFQAKQPFRGLEGAQQLSSVDQANREIQRNGGLQSNWAGAQARRRRFVHIENAC
jgi:hypothetical protein